MGRIRVVTYNTHKCRGIDGRTRPLRIAEVLRETSAAIIALQEVVSRPGAAPQDDQPQFIAEALRMHYVLGAVRPFRDGVYGNAVLSSFPIRMMRNYDLSFIGREERGCMRADIDIGGNQVLHVFNVHLGTAHEERRHQARRLITDELVNSVDISAPRIVMGDFNEWLPGLVTRLLSVHLESPDLRKHLERTRTYPGLLPLMHLDHIYHDPALGLEKFLVHRSRRALIASDHLPLVADFRVPEGQNKNGSK
ncbi:MAG TPA: endonuclease/exonuclease/phosphatase family protein [Bryobacteraceae bacterium]|nr:endonuclease/exonuclease/phosphatase family protein [Bryobacteraceae bacterium]